MKVKTYAVVVLIITTSFVALSAKAVQQAIAVYTSGPVSIDANLKEWKGAIPISPQDVGWSWVRVGQNDPPEVDDCSGNLYLMWDEKYLYFAAERVDDVVHVTNETGVSIYQGDTIVYWLHITDGAKPGTYQIGFAQTKAQGAEAFLWVNLLPAGRETFPPKDVNIEVVEAKNFEGIIFEASMSLTDLGLELKEGLILPYAVSFGDVDEAGVLAGPDEAVVQWPVGWDWSEHAKFGEVLFSAEATAVQANNRLSTIWGCIKECIAVAP